MLIVSSAMHVMAHYYNYERLSRYSPPSTLPPGDQADPPRGSIPVALQTNAVSISVSVCACFWGGAPLCAIFHNYYVFAIVS